MRRPSTNTRASFFGPPLVTYPPLRQMVRAVGRVGPVVASFVQQYGGKNGLRDREPCYLWEPNGFTVPPGIFKARLMGSYPPGDPNALPLYVMSLACCQGGSSLASLTSASPSVAPSVQPSIRPSPSPSASPFISPSPSPSLSPSLSIGSSVSLGAISFSATSLLPGPGCVTDTCGPCPPNSTPLQWLLNVSGFTRAPCTSLNGAFNLFYVGAIHGACVWQTVETLNGFPTWRLVLTASGLWALESQGAIYNSILAAPPCGQTLVFGPNHFVPNNGCSTGASITATPTTNCPQAGSSSASPQAGSVSPSGVSAVSQSARSAASSAILSAISSQLSGGASASSSSSGSPTCCPGATIAAALVLTLTGGGGAGCAPRSYTLTQTGTFTWNSGAVSFGTCVANFTLQCVNQNGSWNFQLCYPVSSPIPGSACVFADLATASCSPLSLVFDLTIFQLFNNCFCEGGPPTTATVTTP